MAAVLEAEATFKKKWESKNRYVLRQPHQAILKYAQTFTKIQLAKSYTQTTMNELEYISVNIGESLQTQTHSFYLPIVNYQTLAKQILWSAHRQLIPSTPGTPPHFFHQQKKATIGKTKQAPFFTFIVSVQQIASYILANCKTCNHAHAIAYNQGRHKVGDGGDASP